MINEKTDIEDRISNRINRAVNGGNKNLDRPGRKKRNSNNVVKKINVNSRSSIIRRGSNNNPGNRNYSSRKKKKDKIMENAEKIYKFLLESKNDPNKLQKLKNKKPILRIVEDLISVKLGGWKDSNDGYFVNESGKKVNKEKWDLHEDTTISPKGTQKSNRDYQWLHQIRKNLQ